MIPKIIHYCWFGRKPLPESAIKCINSWKKYLPDYEIKQWNEDNFDINIIQYTSEAYESKKYAFVSDYARFWILYRYGGIYFDTDVQVIRPFDNIVSQGAFMGREAGAYLKRYDMPTALAVNPGLALGVEAGNSIYKEILDSYKDVSFRRDDGTLNTVTVVEYTTKILIKHGFNDDNDKTVKVGDINIYPADVFCPMDSTRSNTVTITDRTVSIHLYDCSWIDHKSMEYRMRTLKNWLAKKLGADFIAKVSDVLKGR